MKKLLYASLFAVSSFGFASCMNGDYDANPLTDNSNIKNPLLDTANHGGGSGGSGGGGGGGSTAAHGQIVANVAGKHYVFTNGHITDLGSTKIIAAGFDDYSHGYQSYSLDLRLDNYTGPGTYTIATSMNNGGYTVTDPLANPALLGYDADQGPGSGSITVTSDAGGDFKGTFNFIAYKSTPTASTTEKVDVTNGSFDVGP